MRRLSLLTRINNLYSYIKCSCLSKFAIYDVYYLEQSSVSIDSKTRVNINFYPVILSEDDYLSDLPDMELVESGTNKVITDYANNISVKYSTKDHLVFILSARLFGGKSGKSNTSILDITKNRKRQFGLLYQFIRHQVRDQHLDNLENVRLGTIRELAPISYKDLPVHDM